MDNKTATMLLIIAGVLMFAAGVIFAVLAKWLFAAIIWVGAFCCAVAAYNFKNDKSEK